jgi:hypothetical protein
VLHGLMSHLKARIDVALKSTACGVVAAMAALIALVFFCTAAFIALEARFGVIDACLTFGGAFVLVAAVAGTILLALKRRVARARANLARALDPQALVAGAEIYRLLGGRRAASVGLVGAFIIGILLSRNVPRK